MEIHGKDPALLRRINATATARLLYERGAMTLTEVVDATGLSRRTAEAVLGSLVDAGTVEQLPPDDSVRQVGRPPRAFRFRRDSGVCLGIHVSRDRADLMVTDLAGGVLVSDTREIDRDADRADRIAALIDGVRAGLRRARIPRKRLRAVGIGTPGVVASDGVVRMCNTIPDWEGVDLRAELEGWTRCPVSVDNDVNLAAMAEHRYGVARDRDAVVWVLTGHSTRAALIVGGRLYRGADGAAGEIGWLPELGWKRVRDRADHPAPGRHAELARSMAPGLASLVLTMNPAMLVIGGLDEGTGEEFLGSLRAELQRRCLMVPELRISVLGADGVVRGAVRVAVDEVQRQMFTIR